MDENNQQTQESANTQASQPANSGQSEQAPSPENTAQYWRDKYNGLQGYAKTLQNQVQEFTSKLDTVQGEKQALVAEYEQQTRQLQSEFTSLKSQFDDIAPKYEQLNQEYTGLKRKTEVGDLIQTEYPELAGLWRKGLIDIGSREGDDLQSYLGTYAEELGKMQDNSFKKDLEGTTPSNQTTGDKSPAKTSVNDLRQNMSKLLQEKGVHSNEYKEAFDLYIQALASASGN